MWTSLHRSNTLITFVTFAFEFLFILDSRRQQHCSSLQFLHYIFPLSTLVVQPLNAISSAVEGFGIRQQEFAVT